MRELLARALGGDKIAEEEFFGILLVRFTAFAKLKLGEEDAEDVAQEACMTVLHKYNSLPNHDNFMAWAHTVLRNKIGNYLSRNRRWKKLISDISPHFEDVLGLQPRQDSKLERRIIECLKVLRKHDSRYVRILNFLHQGYTTEEICGKLGITRNHLYVLLSRSRAKLADCLEDRSE